MAGGPMPFMLTEDPIPQLTNFLELHCGQIITALSQLLLNFLLRSTLTFYHCYSVPSGPEALKLCGSEPRGPA